MFSENLRKIRKKKNYTQKQLSEKIGMHCATISSYETGISEPTISTVLKIALALDCDFFDLIPANEILEQCVKENVKGQKNGEKFIKRNNQKQLL